MMFPTQAIRSGTQRKILRVLAEKNKRYTVQELAEMCQRSEASISRALDEAGRYPFLERDNIAGSKKLAVRLDPDSEYTRPIREFFAIERDRERASGTVPVQVWNLLEDITVRAERKIDGLIEICLFGSYATGDYYAGSDIDLLFLHRPQDEYEDVRMVIEELLDAAVPEDQDVQPLVVEVPDGTDSEELRDVVEQQSPVQDIDTIIPLLGEADIA